MGGCAIFGLPCFYCLAWLLILQWHVQIHPINITLSRLGIPIYPLKYSLRILGLNLVVAFQYFGAPITRMLPGRLPFISCALAIIIDTFVFPYIVERIGGALNVAPSTPVHRKRVDQKDGATNVYEDLTISFGRVLAIFLVQVVCAYWYNKGIYTATTHLVYNFTEPMSGASINGTSIYGTSINGTSINGTNINGTSLDDTVTSERVIDFQKADCFVWFVVVLLQMAMSDLNAELGFTQDLWSKYLIAADKLRLIFACLNVARHEDNHSLVQSMRQVFEQGEDQRIWFDLPLPQKTEMVSRMVMDLLVNGILRTTILYTFAINMCVKAPPSLVMDFMVLLFIARVDDLDEAKLFQEITSTLKIRRVIERKVDPRLFTRGELKLNECERKYVEGNSDKFGQLQGQMEHETWEACLGSGA